MEKTEAKGDLPAQETGMGESSSGLSGDQLFQEFLKRGQVEEPEVVEVPEKEVEEPEEAAVEVPEDEPAGEEATEEQPEETEAEPEEADHEEDGSLTDDDEQRVPYKRLSKEVARRKDLEERLKKSQARLAELEASAERPVESGPQQPVALAEVQTPEQLAQIESGTREAVDFLEDKLIDGPDAVNDDGEPAYRVQGEQYSEKDLRRMLKNARRRLEREVPQRRQYIEAKRNVEVAARNDFTWLSDRNSQEYQAYSSIMRGIPALSVYPGATALVAAAVEGMKVVHGRKTAQKPKVKASTPPPMTTTESAPRLRVKDTAAERKRARLSSESKILSKGNLSGSDLESVFLNRLKERD